MKPAIIIHGGAKTIAEEKIEANLKGSLAAVEAGWAILEKGGHAKDATDNSFTDIALRIRACLTLINPETLSQLTVPCSKSA